MSGYSIQREVIASMGLPRELSLIGTKRMPATCGATSFYHTRRSKWSPTILGLIEFYYQERER